MIVSKKQIQRSHLVRQASKLLPSMQCYCIFAPAENSITLL